MADKETQDGYTVDAVDQSSNSERVEENVELKSLKGTQNDEHDMRMLGRTQVLNVYISLDPHFKVKSNLLTFLQRNFRFISTLGFACTLMSTWEIALMYVLCAQMQVRAY